MYLGRKDSLEFANEISYFWFRGSSYYGMQYEFWLATAESGLYGQESGKHIQIMDAIDLVGPVRVSVNKKLAGFCIWNAFWKMVYHLWHICCSSRLAWAAITTLHIGNIHKALEISPGRLYIVVCHHI